MGTHPNAVNTLWSLILGPHHHFPSLTYSSYLLCLRTGVFSNYKQWCTTWMEETR